MRKGNPPAVKLAGPPRAIAIASLVHGQLPGAPGERCLSEPLTLGVPQLHKPFLAFRCEAQKMTTRFLRKARMRATVCSTICKAPLGQSLIEKPPLIVVGHVIAPGF